MDMTGSYLLIIGHFFNLHHLSAPNSTHNLTGLVRTVILCLHGECCLTLTRMAPAGMTATTIPDPGKNKRGN